MDGELILVLFFLLAVGIVIFNVVHSRYHYKGDTTDERVVTDYGEPQKTLYTSTKIFSLHRAMDITDEKENVVYTAKTKFWTLHDRTWIYDSNEKEVAYVYKKFFTIHERRIVEMANGTNFELSNELFHIIKDITNIEGLGWKLEGNFLALNFTIKDQNDQILAVIGQKVLSLHDKSSIDIYDTSKEAEIITIVISLQHMLVDRRNASSSANAANSSSSSAN